MESLLFDDNPAADPAEPGLRLVQLEAVQILHGRRIGRPADEGREHPDVPNVVA